LTTSGTNDEPVAGASPGDPVDRLIIQLRAYIAAKPGKFDRPARPWNSGIAVIFDTETTTDPSQRLRFGAYQIRHDGGLLERGIFHADDMPAAEIAILQATLEQDEPSEDGERIVLRSRAEFVEEVLFKWGHEVGGLIIGFNLPFDLSRIAIAHSYGKRDMRGGFSFTLAEKRPNVGVKHLSQRAAFINFRGKGGSDKRPDRGFFVDVKTLAATLTSGSHSLDSLSKLLGTTPKSSVDTYDGPLTPEFVRYGMNDVQVTWECFAELASRYEAHGLKTGMHELYSEASLGKAFLSAMKIKPWREVQPNFPPELIGQIMSTYFGGRAEVHIRRDIAPVIHCDFLSMYPTVCTLMQLWRYVIADGVSWTDATQDIRKFVECCTLDDLRDPQYWQRLTCIVQVLPNDDVFPVRASYEKDQSATIGLNHLTSREPMWFTLADVLAAKLIGGKAPEIVSALRFEPVRPQGQLRTIKLEGAEVSPDRDDFYKLLIDRRRVVQAQEKSAPEHERPALKAAQQSLKILANSTSYGIFVELNVETLDKAKTVSIYDFRGQGRKTKARKVEKPGRYFHPLLATSITGAARLMLALAERNTLDQGLDWAFCDTDSLAIANTAGLPDTEFFRRVEAVRAWFEPLNPYAVKGSILQLEKVNFPIGADDDMAQQRPVNCLAISAKRYVLFDRDAYLKPAIRKASAHGLGHLLEPYKDDDRAGRIARIGVELWQEELWREIIGAFDAGHPDEVDYTSMRNFDEPAASRYAATNQTLLKWFASYNETVPEHEQVWPFNFLLAFQTKTRMEMAGTDPDALSSPAWSRRSPSPASRYSSNLILDRPPIFDRRTGEPVPWQWLKSYRRTLVRHHLHSEMKFLGGVDDERGILRRRHVHAWAAIPIGKEADNLEERQTIGEDDDAVQWSLASTDRKRIARDIEEVLAAHRISDRTLWSRAGVSHHTLADLRKGWRVTELSLLSLAQAAEELRQEALVIEAERGHWLEEIRKLVAEAGSIARLAEQLGVSRQYLGRVMRGEKSVTNELVNRLRAKSDSNFYCSQRSLNTVGRGS
jgi:hypothetical protein